MNVVVRTTSPEIPPQPADPLDHLAGVLFHKMGTDGVYARTALYEDMVERLAALITRHREPNTEVIPLRSEAQPTACMSFNYHRDHFGTTWDIKDDKGEPAHTGCVAFGMDRLAVAMFHTHGTDPAKWPAALRELLGL